MTDADKAELARLQALRSKRADKLGWSQNVKAIDAAIAALKAKE